MVHKNHIIRNNNYDTAILNKVSRTKNEQEKKKKNHEQDRSNLLMLEKTKSITKLFKKNPISKSLSKPKIL